MAGSPADPDEVFRSKPDPDEPWRFVCPDCHGQVHMNKCSTLYRCKDCKESFEKDELHDRAGPIR